MAFHNGTKAKIRKKRSDNKFERFFLIWCQNLEKSKVTKVKSEFFSNITHYFISCVPLSFK